MSDPEQTDAPPVTPSLAGARFGSSLPGEAVRDGEHIDKVTRGWALLLTALYWAAAPAGAALLMYENRRSFDTAAIADVVGVVLSAVVAIGLITVMTYAAVPERALLRRWVLIGVGVMIGVVPFLIGLVHAIGAATFGSGVEGAQLLALGLSLAGLAMVVGVGVGVGVLFPKAGWSRVVQGVGSAVLLAAIWIPFDGRSLADALSPGSGGSVVDATAQVAALTAVHLGTLGPLATALFVRRSQRLEAARWAQGLIMSAHAVMFASLVVTVLDNSWMSFWDLWAILTVVLCWMAGLGSIAFGLSTLLAQRAWTAHWRRRIAPDQTAEAGTLEAALLALERRREQGDIDDAKHRELVQAALKAAAASGEPDENADAT